MTDYFLISVHTNKKKYHVQQLIPDILTPQMQHFRSISAMLNDSYQIF